MKKPDAVRRKKGERNAGKRKRGKQIENRFFFFKRERKERDLDSDV